MSEINRSVVVVKPKQPFLDWIHSWDDDRYTLDDLRDDSPIYLIPEYGSFDEQRKILESAYGWIFEEELYSWYTEEDVWPKNRDLEMFLEWFELEFHSLVMDLADTIPLKHIGKGPDDDVSSNGH